MSARPAGVGVGCWSSIAPVSSSLAQPHRPDLVVQRSCRGPPTVSWIVPDSNACRWRSIAASVPRTSAGTAFSSSWYRGGAVSTQAEVPSGVVQDALVRERLHQHGQDRMVQLLGVDVLAAASRADCSRRRPRPERGGRHSSMGHHRTSPAPASRRTAARARRPVKCSTRSSRVAPIRNRPAVSGLPCVGTAAAVSDGDAAVCDPAVSINGNRRSDPRTHPAPRREQSFSTS